MKYIHNSFFIIALLFVYACGSSDLSFINEVKRFEPRWMSLSEKAAKIQHNLSITGRRYEKDMQAVSPMIQKDRENWATLFSQKNQYRRIITERDSLEARYIRQKELLTETVYKFNDWENKLMKNKLKETDARREFEDFRMQQAALEEEMSEIYTDLVKNIESHNAILRRLAQSLNLFNNFDIDPK